MLAMVWNAALGCPNSVAQPTPPPSLTTTVTSVPRHPSIPSLAGHCNVGVPPPLRAQAVVGVFTRSASILRASTAENCSGQSDFQQRQSPSDGRASCASPWAWGRTLSPTRCFSTAPSSAAISAVGTVASGAGCTGGHVSCLAGESTSQSTAWALGNSKVATTKAAVAMAAAAVAAAAAAASGASPHPRSTSRRAVASVGPPPRVQGFSPGPLLRTSSSSQAPTGVIGRAGVFTPLPRVRSMEPTVEGEPCTRSLSLSPSIGPPGNGSVNMFHGSVSITPGTAMPATLGIIPGITPGIAPGIITPGISGAVGPSPVPSGSPHMTAQSRRSRHTSPASVSFRRSRSPDDGGSTVNGLPLPMRARASCGAPSPTSARPQASPIAGSRQHDLPPMPVLPGPAWRFQQPGSESPTSPMCGSAQFGSGVGPQPASTMSVLSGAKVGAPCSRSTSQLSFLGCGATCATDQVGINRSQAEFSINKGGMSVTSSSADGECSSLPEPEAEATVSGILDDCVCSSQPFGELKCHHERQRGTAFHENQQQQEQRHSKQELQEQQHLGPDADCQSPDMPTAASPGDVQVLPRFTLEEIRKLRYEVGQQMRELEQRTTRCGGLRLLKSRATLPVQFGLRYVGEDGGSIQVLGNPAPTVLAAGTRKFDTAAPGAASAGRVASPGNGDDPIAEDGSFMPGASRRSESAPPAREEVDLVEEEASGGAVLLGRSMKTLPTGVLRHTAYDTSRGAGGPPPAVVVVADAAADPSEEAVPPRQRWQDNAVHTCRAEGGMKLLRGQERRLRQGLRHEQDHDTVEPNTRSHAATAQPFRGTCGRADNDASQVESLFFDSLPRSKVEVERVEYVINPRLLDQFLRRAEGEEASVEVTFHGTRKEHTERILEEGLLAETCHTGAYGLGAYVGCHAGVAHMYADPDPDGRRYMCVALACVGRQVEKGRQGVKASRTAADCLVNPTQYCFVDNDRLLVTHLITYNAKEGRRRRIGGGFSDPFATALTSAIRRAGLVRRSGVAR